MIQLITYAFRDGNLARIYSMLSKFVELLLHPAKLIVYTDKPHCRAYLGCTWSTTTKEKLKDIQHFLDIIIGPYTPQTLDAIKSHHICDMCSQLTLQLPQQHSWPVNELVRIQHHADCMLSGEEISHGTISIYLQSYFFILENKSLILAISHIAGLSEMKLGMCATTKKLDRYIYPAFPRYYIIHLYTPQILDAIKSHHI